MSARNISLTLSLISLSAFAPSFSSLCAQDLQAHWEFSNSGGSGPAGDTYVDSENSIGMAWDSGTTAPAYFDDNQVRVEGGTRFEANDPAVNLTSFSVVMVIDPISVNDFGSFITKESQAPDTFADFQRVSWQIQHTTDGNLEFVVRGSDPGTKDFFGSASVLSANSGFDTPAFDSFSTDDIWQVAAGYDSVTGDAFFYVTNITGGSVTSLVGGAASFDAGMTIDASDLSIGLAQTTSGYLGANSGFDADDLQIYNGLLSESDLLYMANNPGVAIPEPGSFALLAGMCALVFLMYRKRQR